MPADYQIKNVPLAKLHPDPRQPRKFFSEDSVAQLAESIKQTGIIKPIEVDSKGVVVTGEFRLRAAKLAGLKEIPCRVIDLKPEERLKRQIHENVHVYPMSPIETAKALRQLFGARAQTTDIAKELGKSHQWVGDYLRLLEMPKEIQMAVQKQEIGPANVRPIARVFDLEKRGEVRKGTAKKLTEKVVKKELRTLHALERVSRAIADNPNSAMGYLNQNFKGKGEMEVQAALDRVAPTYISQKLTLENAVEAMTRASKTLEKRLGEFPYDRLGTMKNPLLRDLMRLRKVMEGWHPDLS